MKRKPFTLFLLAAGLATSAVVNASQVYIFEQIDSNHNGAISREEATIRADLIENFTQLDSNGDNSLSVDEYSDYMNKGVPPEDVEIPEPGAAPVR